MDDQLIRNDISRLENISKDIRRKSLDLAIKHQDSHLASSFSTVEILVALYEKILGDDDKFILSKGHGCISFYIVLQEKGLNPFISGHPDIDPENGIACTTGSLGHGLPIGMGMAFARKIKKTEGRIFVLLGDGECQEGTIWESLNLARKYKLDNLVIIVDHNGLQALDSIHEIIDECQLCEKFMAFGVRTIETDGHDFHALLDSLDEKNIEPGKTTAIIAHTIKGRGLSFMEEKPEWHSRIPAGDLLKQAYDELK